MNTDTSIKRLFICMALIALGTVVFLGLFVGAASAQTFPASTTSLSGYDATPPLLTRVDAREDDDDHGSATVEAEFLDVDSEVDPESDTIQVTEAMVTGCVKTNRKINCKATGMKSGKHSMRVSVKDRYGNRSEREHTFEVTDTVAPIIDSVSATPRGVSVNYHDPAPSSGIASVDVYLDGAKLNCSTGSSGGGCDNDHDDYDDDHDGYDHDRDDYDDDHDGYDDDHDGADEDHDSYYSDSSGSHDSDGHYNDSDSDHNGSSSTGFTCPIREDLGCGDHTVTVVVTDKAGNSATSTATVNSGADCTPPSTTDNAPAGWQNTDVSVTLTCTDAGSGCASTTYELDAGASQYGANVAVTGDGIHSITYRSTDVADNMEADKTATVMIDKTPPDVTTSGDMTVEATGPSGAIAEFTSSATDTLSGVVGETSCSPASGSTFPLGITTVSCSAIDAAGNTGTASFTIAVVDTTAPVLTLPGDMIVQATGPTVPVSYAASATDTVDGAVAVICAPASGDAFPIGTTFVSCAATDAAGNLSTGTFSVVVCQSGRPPLSILCPKLVNPNDPNQDIFWKDKANRILTIKYTFTNGTGADAYNVKILSSSGANGNIVCLTPLPALVGDIPSGSSVKFALDYQLPPTSVSLTMSVNACAEDQCGNVYQ